MARVSLTINGHRHAVDVEPDTPLLWVLRDTLGLTGTKFGCGKALCGSCTVHLVRDGRPVALRSCAAPISQLEGAEIVTIEGLSATGNHPVQQPRIVRRDHDPAREGTQTVEGPSPDEIGDPPPARLPARYLGYPWGSAGAAS